MEQLGIWEGLSRPWQVAFEQAWEAYCEDSIPIGAVIVNVQGEIISTGRNRLYEKEAPVPQLSGVNLAHAEINALVQLKKSEHPQLKTYTLYTTMEPCPQCFGAFYMSGIRNLKFAARDNYAGSTNLIGMNEYLSLKRLSVTGPETILEEFQFIIKTDFLLRKVPSDQTERLLERWSRDCPCGVRLGRKWFSENRLLKAKELDLPISAVIKEIEESLVKDEISARSWRLRF